MEKQQPYQLIGLMSGTSLDGLDMAICEFSEQDQVYNYHILAAKTVNYTNEWKNKLEQAKLLSADNYFALHADYGRQMARWVNEFIFESNATPKAIASHGHTVFHQPALGFSTQLGCGATLAANTKLTTVCDFRSLDVALGGQGAPLVPIGDAMLFKQYQACLNLGGIANISFNTKDGKRVAYDVCEANMLLNYLAQKTGKPYDEFGNMARSGALIPELLAKLELEPFYQQQGAKSLGREWFEQNRLSLIHQYWQNTADTLATSVEHIANRLANELNTNGLSNVLVSGGGALNTFLMERLRAKTNCVIHLPESNIVQFKEALIFAFLGYLRLQSRINTLQSVTGASRNSIGGAVYL